MLVGQDHLKWRGVIKIRARECQKNVRVSGGRGMNVGYVKRGVCQVWGMSSEV